jgi:tetratricopeptide (TPR) repeat protein
MIQMDADEIMEKKDAAKVRDTVRSAHKTTANLVHMVLINKSKDSDDVMSVINTGKIMRVLPGLHFKNRVHNRLVCTGDVIQTNLTIYHHGYSLPDAETMKNKRDRTTRLLLMQRAEQPDDPETAHYLAIQYLRMDDWEMAIEIGKQAIVLWENFEPLSQLQLLTLHTTAMAYYQLGSACKTREEQQVYFTEAIKYSEMALDKYPDYLDSNCLLSSIYFATKDHKNCQKYAEKFLASAAMIRSDNSKSLVIPLMSMKHEWMVCLQLAINYFEQADSASAISMVGRGEALLAHEDKYKVTWGVFKYMITLGDAVSLKNAESIYMVGFRPDVK